jgi:hypothetical protein
MIGEALDMNTKPRKLTRSELVAFLNAQGCIVLNDKHDNLIVVLPDRLIKKPQAATPLSA